MLIKGNSLIHFLSLRTAVNFSVINPKKAWFERIPKLIVHVVQLLKQLLAKIIEAASLQGCKLCRIIVIKYDRLYQWKNETGWSGMEHLSAQKLHPKFAFTHTILIP